MNIFFYTIPYYHYILLLANIIITLLLAWHALLYKRDPKASLGWITVILIFPIIGPFFYFLFGINRIRTRARKLTGKLPFSGFLGFNPVEEYINPALASLQVPENYSGLLNISNSISRMPLTTGNHLEILHNGESAYPVMLDAIDNARHSIYLSSYIFKTDHLGKLFIDKLGGAVNRNVDVRVIIDGIGEYYSIPRAGNLLKKKGVKVARFLPPGIFPPSIHINLRNHRKILIVDNKKGFIGGMNIGAHHFTDNLDNKSRVSDTHFQISGPIISQILQVFIEDWNFLTGENLISEIHDMKSDDEGAKCRVIAEGPNEDFDKLATILVGAIASARKRVLIMTPYFLPNRDMISALQTAALKGVNVDVILPSKNNLIYVHWATRNMLWELLHRGVRVFYQPPPFVHTKLLVVDDYYAHIGTANLDSRSLRLNFELVVEIFDKNFIDSISTHIIKCRDNSQPVSLKEIDSRPVLVRTRDALAWLFYPYL